MSTIFENNNVSLYLDNLILLEERVSEKQNNAIFKHKTLGNVLVINNEIQHVEAWIPYYHEMVVHLPISFVREPKKALILGGGDLFAAMELLKYPSIKEIILVEHDKEVIYLMKKHYDHIFKYVDFSRLKIIYHDAKNYLENCNEKFDIIINDCFDLVNSFSNDLKIYDYISDCLSAYGICSDLIYRHIFESETNRTAIENIIGNYHAAFSLVAIPEYPGVLHILSIWGKNQNISQNIKIPVNEQQQLLIRDKKIESYFSLYNPEYLCFYLYLPPYIRHFFKENSF